MMKVQEERLKEAAEKAEKIKEDGTFVNQYDSSVMRNLNNDADEMYYQPQS